MKILQKIRWAAFDLWRALMEWVCEKFYSIDHFVCELCAHIYHHDELGHYGDITSCAKCALPDLLEWKDKVARAAANGVDLEKCPVCGGHADNDIDEENLTPNPCFDCEVKGQAHA